MEEKKPKHAMTMLAAAAALAAGEMSRWDAEVKRLPMQRKRRANKAKKAKRKMQRASRRANRK